MSFTIILYKIDCVMAPHSMTKQQQLFYLDMIYAPIARFMGPTWGPSAADRTQVGPMLSPWTLLSGMLSELLRYKYGIYWDSRANYHLLCIWTNPTLWISWLWKRKEINHKINHLEEIPFAMVKTNLYIPLSFMSIFTSKKVFFFFEEPSSHTFVFNDMSLFEMKLMNIA